MHQRRNKNEATQHNGEAQTRTTVIRRADISVHCASPSQKAFCYSLTLVAWESKQMDFPFALAKKLDAAASALGSLQRRHILRCRRSISCVTSIFCKQAELIAQVVSANRSRWNLGRQRLQSPSPDDWQGKQNRSSECALHPTCVSPCCGQHVSCSARRP